MKTKKKIYVGMSGGVDSSLAAALLLEQNLDVVGVYMKNWTQNLPGMNCPWARDLADAKRVAVHLGIPFKVFDFQKEYKNLVVDYMLAEYARGRTPNPDIMCNQEVKFRLFLDAAIQDGADLIATGHYARTTDGRLLRAKNSAKDQTYFLYRVNSAALEKTIFPLGDFLDKETVRQEAAKRGIATAKKRDSQGICFVGEVGIREFLSQFVETRPGNIIEKETGEILGRHDGAIFYTFGQRHGLNIGGGLPYYVVGKNIAKNEVYVSRNLNAAELWTKEIPLNNLHWISKERAANSGENYSVRVRHRAPLIDAQFVQENGGDLKYAREKSGISQGDCAKIIFSEPIRAVAPGQSVVIYSGEEVLGGGIAQ